MNKWLLLILGIISILILSYLSFTQKATIIKEDLLKKAEIIHKNPAFKDVYVKLKGDGFALTRELVLLGSVSTKEEKALASSLLKDIEGVTNVNNLLKVPEVKPIIKEIESIEVEKTPKKLLQKEKVENQNIVQPSIVDNNETNNTIEDKNISKENNETNNTTNELNSTQQEPIKVDERNLTQESNETNQSSCQEQLNTLLKRSKIQFAHNSSKIEKSSYPQLDQLSMILKSCSPKLIVIDGYTDNSGNALYNKRLSQQRANNIKTYLLSKGLDKKSIKAFGHGAKNPIASNKTKEGREKNRRIEFSIKGTK